MPKVLISDKLSPEAAAIFEDRGITADVKTGLTPEELIAIIPDYDGLAIRSATKVTPAVLAAATKLKVVGRAGIGVDNVDIAAATAQGVIVMNTPFGNSITTAEHAISMMMALARQIPQANASTHAGKWEKSKFMGVELYGKTFGLIGCGNIGGIAADRALGLKMKVVAYDPYLTEDRARELGVKKVELQELFAAADFISLHTPLTDATRNIIDAKALNSMKKGVRIVNCARGGLVDEVALKAALDAGHVGGAALDVFLEEPAKENALFGHPSVICTPHLGASTLEAQENVALQVAEQMSDYLLTGAVTNALNMPSVSAEEAPRLKPYIALAEQLGSLLGQVTETSIKSVEIIYSGDCSQLNTRPVRAAALAGLLKPIFAGVNMVSAPAFAEGKGIRVTDGEQGDAQGYQNRVQITVVTERRSRTVAGSIFDGDKPRLVQVEDIALEAEVTPHMLFVRNFDKPGLIGRLGTALGDAGVNIANFHLGRNATRDGAIALVAVDEAVPETVLDDLRRLPDVERAFSLSF